MRVEEAIEGAASASPAAFAAIVEYARAGRLQDDHIGALAQALARSGEELVPPGGAAGVDIASTGGPSSLTTILCPLYLAALGCLVVKLGVPGRPAGGIDVLAQLPGFRFNLVPRDAIAVLEVSKYVHLRAGTTFAPADAALFEYRRQQHAVAIPELVMASLLAKKLCVGVRRAGIDIRVGEGANWGSSWDEARTQARRFIRVAGTVGVELVCFLTGGGVPYQPFIGRGEALVALRKVLDAEPDPWLDQHVDACFRMSAIVARRDDMRPSRAALRTVARMQLAAQGAGLDALHDRSHEIESAHSQHVVASRNGFVQIDMPAVRQLIVEQQTAHAGEQDFPDPAGVTLRYSKGTFLEKGSVLATFRGFTSPPARQRLHSAFTMVSEPTCATELEVITT